MGKLTPELLYRSVEKLIECKEYINSYEEGIGDDKEKYNAIIKERNNIRNIIETHIKEYPLTLDFIINYTRFVKEVCEAKLLNL